MCFTSKINIQHTSEPQTRRSTPLMSSFSASLVRSSYLILQLFPCWHEGYFNKKKKKIGSRSFPWARIERIKPFPGPEYSSAALPGDLAVNRTSAEHWTGTTTADSCQPLSRQSVAIPLQITGWNIINSRGGKVTIMPRKRGWKRHITALST